MGERTELRDYVFMLDQQQSDPARAVLCPKGGAKHGRLLSEGTGLMFMCRCGVQVPATLSTVED